MTNSMPSWHSNLAFSVIVASNNGNNDLFVLRTMEQEQCERDFVLANFVIVLLVVTCTCYMWSRVCFAYVVRYVAFSAIHSNYHCNVIFASQFNGISFFQVHNRTALITVLHKLEKTIETNREDLISFFQRGRYNILFDHLTIRLFIYQKKIRICFYLIVITTGLRNLHF